MDDEQLQAAKARLGPVGVWLSPLRFAPMDQMRAAAARIEDLGYGSLWTGEGIGGPEAFALHGVLLAATSRIITGTGIANLWARHPATMEGGAGTLGAAYPGRFVLGIGVSHAPLVEGGGLTYERPLTRMREYLDGMDAAAGNAPVAEPPVPRLLAALGPQMLALAAERADGAHPYFVPVEHTAVARAALGPGKLLIPEQAVVLETDPTVARTIARKYAEVYLRLPNYVRNLRNLGYSEDDVAGLGSDRLVDAVVAWGDLNALAARVDAHRQAGADHVVLQPLGDLRSALAQLDALAPAVLSR